MKKTISMILVLATVFTLLTSVAFAINSPAQVQNTFGYKTINCAVNGEKMLNDYLSAIKSSNLNRLYVRHYLNGNFGGVYTNYFKASQSYSSKTGLVGGDWMAPDTANYVRSNSIQKQAWYAWGRANTDYGLSTIQISGYSHIDG